MDKEKAIKIHQYYDIFRLVMIFVFIGLLMYLTL